MRSLVRSQLENSIKDIINVRIWHTHKQINRQLMAVNLFVRSPIRFVLLLTTLQD